LSETNSIHIEDLSEDAVRNLVGPGDCNLNALAESFGRQISYRDRTFFVKDCSETEKKEIETVINELCKLSMQGKSIGEQDVSYACRLVGRNEALDLNEIHSHIVGRTLAGKAIAPKTKGQYEFVKAMESKDIVFATGPAGTGKTFLAVIHAVTELKKGDVKRIVLTRPAVEAGENLGFLPGDLKEKVDPYLTPLYDALHDMLGAETTEKLIERGTIEIAPLAYMRGRTLDDSYVILDEAQNTTAAQMKMFLTRLGFHSHMIITGDVTQVDLCGRQESGLVQAVRILKNINGIAIMELTSDDVVRHPLVQKIIERYESVGKGSNEKSKD
jgi:phosphate starvation-inducible PhoH-like protein